MGLSHHEVDTVVLEDVEVVDGREPDGVGGSVEFIVEETAEILLLFIIELCLVEHADVMLLQLIKDRINGLGVFCGISLIELIDSLECLLQGLTVLLGQGFAVGQAVEGSHPHSEKLVEVVAVNAEEGKALQQGHFRLLGLLENAVVEVHPTHVALHVHHLLFYLFHRLKLLSDSLSD